MVYNKTTSFITLLHKNNIFLLYIYLSIITQISLTYFVINLFRQNEYLSNVSKRSFWIYLALSSLVIFIISFINFPLWFEFILFMIYAVIYAAMLHHLSYFIPKEIVDQVLIGMIYIFSLLSIIFYILSFYNYNITFLIFIIIGLFIGIITVLIIKYNYINEKKISADNINILYIILISLSIYFTYSTNVVLRKEYNGNFITAAVDLYLGFLNTFIYVIGLDEYI